MRVAVDGAPGWKDGCCDKILRGATDCKWGRDFWTIHCSVHQEALCCKLLKKDHVMGVIVRTVNSILARGINHRQFDSLLIDKAQPIACFR